MKIFKIILFISCFIAQSYAQQVPQFNMFWNNYSFYNPAATGLFYKHYAAVNARHQWIHFGCEPKTINAVYDFKWTKINSGIGINYLYDQLGFERNSEFTLNYSYQFDLKKDRVLSAGISFGFMGKQIDFSKLTALDPNDPLLYPLPLQSGDVLFNINIGTAFKTPHLFVGASVMQLNEYKSHMLNYKNIRHYFIACSYNTDIGEKFNIKPGIFVMSDKAITELNIDFITFYKKRIWAGLVFRETDAIGLMAGVDIKGKYRVGYSYYYLTSKASINSRSSHEVVLALMMDDR
jgi:type IX secretion system PorP/SprF family membrane protein